MAHILHLVLDVSWLRHSGSDVLRKAEYASQTSRMTSVMGFIGWFP
jgi:hypothetical protein